MKSQDIINAGKILDSATIPKTDRMMWDPETQTMHTIKLDGKVISDCRYGVDITEPKEDG